MRRLTMLFAFGAAAALGIGCRDSNSITGARLIATPNPIPNVAGVWTGSYDAGEDLDCTASTSAQASFTVDDQNVTGTLNAAGDCGFENVLFQGTIQGSTLTGTISGSRFSPGSRASGDVYGSTGLQLILVDGQFAYSGGAMNLHR